MLNYEIKTALHTSSVLERYIKPSDIILDVGSGTGLVADCIRRKTGAHVVCLDVIQDMNANEKSILFDGKNIPFRNDTFTMSICCFVLHHTPFQKKLIEEMKRVTKSKIIILEDVTEVATDYFLVFLHKLYSGFRYKSFHTRFRNDLNWRRLFSECGLLIDKVFHLEKTREITYPVSRRGYLLLKKRSSVISRIPVKNYSRRLQYEVAD